MWGDVPKSSALLSPSPFWFPGTLGPDSCPASRMDQQMAPDGCTVNVQALLPRSEEQAQPGPGGRLVKGSCLASGQNACYGGGTCKALVEGETPAGIPENTPNLQEKLMQKHGACGDEKELHVDLNGP